MLFIAALPGTLWSCSVAFKPIQFFLATTASMTESRSRNDELSSKMAWAPHMLQIQPSRLSYGVRGSAEMETNCKVLHVDASWRVCAQLHSCKSRRLLPIVTQSRIYLEFCLPAYSRQAHTPPQNLGPSVHRHAQSLVNAVRIAIMLCCQTQWERMIYICS